jgi:hypothetical protein
MKLCPAFFVVVVVVVVVGGLLGGGGGVMVLSLTENCRHYGSLSYPSQLHSDLVTFLDGPCPVSGVCSETVYNTSSVVSSECSGPACCAVFTNAAVQTNSTGPIRCTGFCAVPEAPASAPIPIRCNIQACSPDINVFLHVD